MSDYFLDTSTILCGVHSYEQHHTKAKKLINEDYLLSILVYNELKNIKERRDKIYNAVLNIPLEQGWSLDDVYKRCFKANSANNVNDSKHLKEVFEHVLANLKVDSSTIIDESLRDRFTLEIDDVFEKIKFYLLQQFHSIENTTSAKKRIIEQNVGGKFTRLLKSFKKLREYSKNKNDVTILIHGVEYSCHSKIFINIVSKDVYFYNVSSDVEKYAKRIFPDKKEWFKIYYLPQMNI